MLSIHIKPSILDHILSNPDFGIIKNSITFETAQSIGISCQSIDDLHDLENFVKAVTVFDSCLDDDSLNMLESVSFPAQHMKFLKILAKGF